MNIKRKNMVLALFWATKTVFQDLKEHFEIFSANNGETIYFIPKQKDKPIKIIITDKGEK